MGRIDLVEIRRRQAARQKQKHRERFIRTRLKNWRWYVWLPVAIPFGLFVIVFSYAVAASGWLSRFLHGLEGRFDRSITPYTRRIMKWLNAPYESENEEEDDD